MKKKEKGITLIALVVTIVVLLILAGVSISMLTGDNGIIKKAGEAKEQTEIAKETEIINLSIINTMGRKLEESDIKNELDNYLGDSLLTTVNKHNEGIVVSFTESGRKYLIHDNGTVENLIIKWKYDENGKITDGTNTIKIGDYVNYDPTNYEGYNESTAVLTSTEEQSGWADNQIFKLSSYNYGWRVLGIDEITGEIQLISEDCIGPDSGGEEDYGRTYYLLRAQTGLENGVNEINRICAFYGNGKYATGARTITEEDINKITGYNPENEKYGEGSFIEYGMEVTYYWQGTDYPYYSSANGNGSLVSSHDVGFFLYDAINGVKKSNISTMATTDKMEKIATITNSFYEYVVSSYIDTSSVQYKMLFENSINSAIQDSYKDSYEGCDYWLGNNAEWNMEDLISCGYGIGCVYSDNVGRNILLNSIGRDFYGWHISNFGAAGCGIRPIVNLQGNISLNDTNSDGIWEISE